MQGEIEARDIPSLFGEIHGIGTGATTNVEHLAGCAAGSRHVATEPAPLTVREVQTLERELGFEATPNFERRASEAFEHCYYTAPLRLPEDYSGLWFKRGRDGVCLLNERKYDVFYYAPEALAGSR